MGNYANKRLPRSTNRFSEVPKAQISRSTFNRSHGVKTTFDSGKLIPIYVDEALPGDTFTMSMNGFARLATPLHPFMDNVYLDTHFFFVPNRLVWSAWANFMGEEEEPGVQVTYAVPRINSGTTVQSQTTGDYMGLPVDVALGQCNALHFRALNLIWNEFYRDQNLQSRVEVPTDDGPDSYGLYEDLLPRGKRHDYFTSALPFTQKGDPVSLPLGTRADVTFDGAEGDPVNVNLGSTPRRLGTDVLPPAVGENVIIDNIGDSPAAVLYADLSNATSATINDLRQAFQIQKLLERDARGGTRYTEIIKSHFGVTSPDARLQRPEYLGGGTTMINVNPVAQTSTSLDLGETITPQGNLAGVGTAAWGGHGWNKSFTEHGVLIGLMSVRADLNYQQGMDRMWWRQTRYDFFFPALQHLGEQAIYQGELEYVSGTENGVWAFQERHAEYRYKPSKITGQFRSNHPQSLDTWHVAQDFGGVVPGLNADFIEENPALDRVLAVNGAEPPPSPADRVPQLIADLWFNLKSARPMPVYGVPGLIDHF